MNKRRAFVFCLSLSCLLGTISSCSTSVEETNENKNQANSPGDATPIGKPSRGEKTQFYLKNEFKNLKRGQELRLDEFIEVIPGVDEKDDATTFKSSVLTVDGEVASGHIKGGNLTSNTLVLTKPGEVVLQVEANGESKVFYLHVEEEANFAEALATLEKADKNYTINHLDQEGNVINKVYRSDKYIYSSKDKAGYVLSNKDDKIYNFELPILDSKLDELTLGKAPAGDKGDYNNTFVSLKNYSNGQSWIYSDLTEDNLELSKYKYAFLYSGTKSTQFFKSLFFMQSAYQASGTTFIPYLILMNYKNGQLSFLPVVATQTLSAIAFLNEVTITDIGTTRVEALATYVDEFMAPEKTDVTEIIDNMAYLTKLMNYTIRPSFSIKDESGSEIRKSSAIFKNIFQRYAYMHERKIMQNAYWGENFSGIDPTVIAGGLYSVNGKTYHFVDKDKDGSYSEVSEYIDATTGTSLAKWWYYDNMKSYLTSWAVGSSSLVNNAYPDYDEATETYKFENTLDASLTIIKGAFSLGYKGFLANQEPLSVLFEYQSSLTMKFNYKEGTEKAPKNLENVEMVVSILFPKEMDTKLDQDYTYYLTVKLEDIGTTDFSDILDKLVIPGA